MKAKLFMRYGRDKDDSYYGDVWVEMFPTRGRMMQYDFKGHTFPRMMSRLASQIREYGHAEVQLSRLEKEGSEYWLDAGIVQLLKSDPALAIQSMTHPHRILERKDRKNISMSSSTLLRTGHTTLADAFGDWTYIAMKGGLIECPSCGRWKSKIEKVIVDDGAMCEHCGFIMLGDPHGNHLVDGKWFIVSTNYLLDQSNETFFIPRKWNTGGPVIKYDDLLRMYEKFKEDRANADVST